MKVLVTGAAGMIGRKFCLRLARDGAVGGRPVTALHMVDVVAAGDLPGAAFKVVSEAGNIADRALAPRMVADRPDLIVHLAAIVSGEAEVDFDKGYAVNLDGTRHLFDAIRAESILSGGAYRPRVVFSSSIAVFGAPFPDSIPDDFHLTPLTSYGAQKACGEFLLADFTRKGFFDGVVVSDAFFARRFMGKYKPDFPGRLKVVAQPLAPIIPVLKILYFYRHNWLF